jgi:hypothetical protein
MLLRKFSRGIADYLPISLIDGARAPEHAWVRNSHCPEPGLDRPAVVLPVDRVCSNAGCASSADSGLRPAANASMATARALLRDPASTATLPADSAFRAAARAVSWQWPTRAVA